MSGTRSKRGTVEGAQRVSLADCADHPPHRLGWLGIRFTPRKPRGTAPQFMAGVRSGYMGTVAYTLTIPPADRPPGSSRGVSGHGERAPGEGCLVLRAASVEQSVTLSATAQPFGGVRWWMRCPSCGRRCGDLYSRSHVAARFACRRCLGLAYSSQRLGQADRWRARAETLFARVDSRPDCDVVEKPPRMHWRTFDRIVDAAQLYDVASIWRGLQS